jgi:predicted dienelactone hydrolase
MKTLQYSLILFMLLSLVACSTPNQLDESTQPATQIQATQESATASPLPPTATVTVAATVTPAAQDLDVVEGVKNSDLFPLAKPGAYFPGKQNLKIPKPESLGGGELNITMWYPAKKPTDYKGTVAKDAEADRAGAPYPLLLTSTVVGNEYAAHLVSYGFVVAGVDNQGPSELFGNWVIDYPNEYLLMLNHFADNPPDALEGLIDTDHTGALGYSFSGHNNLFIGGGRIDPEYFLTKCAEEPDPGSSANEKLINESTQYYFCAIVPTWNEFTAHASTIATENGLWQPLTDERIRAVVIGAPDRPWLFGDKGLAAIDKPSLMVCGTEDYRETDYIKSCAYTFENLGTQDKNLITFIDRGHMLVTDPETKPILNHFFTAFFGTHLQGKEEYRDDYNQEFLNQFSDLYWGVYEKP